MSDSVRVEGVVISAMPIGDYDKRIVLLTRQRGKISVFARGARRPNSAFLAAANPFVFGTFILFEGRSSYSLRSATILHQFVDLAAHQPGIYYGYYFLEVADYFGRENTDEKEMINLLYVCVKGLLNEALDDRLIRCIFEMRTCREQGLMPELSSCACCHKAIGEEEAFFSLSEHGLICPSCAPKRGGEKPLPVSAETLKVLRHIVSAPLSRLTGFSVSGRCLEELMPLTGRYLNREMDRAPRSLQVLEIMVK